jgi:hypothetical protein
LEAYWLKTDADGRPIGYRVHVAADGRYAPPLDCTYNCVAAGDGDDITISNSIKFTAAMAFRTGMKFRFVAPGTNTGPVTLKIDDQDPKDVIKNGGEDLAAGDIIEDQMVEVVYNATVGYFEIVSTVVTPTPAEPTRTTGTGGVPAAGGEHGDPPRRDDPSGPDRGPPSLHRRGSWIRRRGRGLRFRGRFGPDRTRAFRRSRFTTPRPTSSSFAHPRWRPSTSLRRAADPRTTRR